MAVSNESTGDADGPHLSDPLGVSRIRPAYEQVADQLRELIVGGTLKQGERLPATPELASMFGVGRSTVREALRQLSSQNLINAVRGSKGGSYSSVRRHALPLSDGPTSNLPNSWKPCSSIMRCWNPVSAVRKSIEIFMPPCSKPQEIVCCM